MNAKRNLLHVVALSIWSVLGVIFTVKTLPNVFGDGGAAALLTIASFWIWLAAFGAATTAIIGKFTRPLMAVVVHVASVGVLLLIPQVFPLTLLRLGIDLIASMH